MDDLPGCKILVEQSSPDEPDTLVNQACLLYKVQSFFFCHINFLIFINRKESMKRRV